MSQTCLNDFENPSDHFFTLQNFPHMTWLCHRGVLGVLGSWTEVPGCHPHQPSLLARTQKTAGVPPLRGPGFAPGCKNSHCWSCASLGPHWFWWPLRSRSWCWSCPAMDLSCCLLTRGAVTLGKLWVSISSLIQMLSYHQRRRWICKPGTSEFLSPMCPRNTCPLTTTPGCFI